MKILIFLIIIINQTIQIASFCHLPLNWSGKWYQSKDSDLLQINRTNFINRGSCIEHMQDKFIFYEPKEECFRCIFIMQKHPNVLQYRASYCTEQSDFYSNCQNLSPESELNTIYRDDSASEKCPLSGLYFLKQPNHDINNKCADSANKESMLMECSDQSMLKFQFGICTNMPTFIVNCVAHWTEGNTNYLIGRVTTAQKTSYRCLVYTSSDTSNSVDLTNNRQLRDNDFIDLAKSDSAELPQSSIQISISQDEFCRNIENGIDEQISFTFTKLLGSKHHVAPSSINEPRKIRHANNSLAILNRKELKQNCKFPKWLNKKWHNLKQSKVFSLEYKLDSFIVQDEKNQIVINKYTCSQMKIKKTNHIQAVVKSLNGCSSGYQCLTITAKSDFVLEIKFGKISFGNSAIDCNDNHISQEFVYVDTNYGVKCPLKSGLYEKLDHKSNRVVQKENKESYQACKYLTQTQTLQVGCQNEQQYSLRTKLCYPNQQYKNDQLTSPSTTAYTQLESEINLVCLAHWRQDSNHVIVSRTMSNEILCSIWSSSEDGKFLQLLEIDSNCNYNSKKQQQRINYGFLLVNSCDEQASAYASLPTLASSSARLLFYSFKFYFLFLIFYLIKSVRL